MTSPRPSERANFVAVQTAGLHPSAREAKPWSNQASPFHPRNDCKVSQRTARMLKEIPKSRTRKNRLLNQLRVYVFTIRPPLDRARIYREVLPRGKLDPTPGCRRTRRRRPASSKMKIRNLIPARARTRHRRLQLGNWTGRCLECTSGSSVRSSNQWCGSIHGGGASST